MEADDPWEPESSGAGESKPFSYEQSEKSDIASPVKEKAGQAQEALSGATEAVTEKMSDIGSGIQAKARSAANAVSEVARRGRRAGSEGTQHLQKGYALRGRSVSGGGGRISFRGSCWFFGGRPLDRSASSEDTARR